MRISPASYRIHKRTHRFLPYVQRPRSVSNGLALSYFFENYDVCDGCIQNKTLRASNQDRETKHEKVGGWLQKLTMVNNKLMRQRRRINRLTIIPIERPKARRAPIA